MPLGVGEGRQQPRFKVGSVHKKHEFSSFQQMSVSQKTENVISVCQTHSTVITSQDPVYKLLSCVKPSTSMSEDLTGWDRASRPVGNV